MIARVWNGWTLPENADAYLQFLKEDITNELQQVAGFVSIQILRKAGKAEVAFKTIILFRSLKSIKDFAGADIETAHIPEKAKALLHRYDLTAEHFEVY